MMRCSCQGLHGWVPTAARATPSPAASSSSWARRSPTFAAASAKLSQRPVRTSTSEAISSPTRCSSSGVPWAAAWSSSKRFASESVSGSRTANSSSTASVKSVPFSYASRAERICSSGVSFCVRTGAVTLVGEGLEQSRGDLFPAPVLFNSPPRGLSQGLTVSLGQVEQTAELGRQIPGVPGLEARQPPLLGRVFGFEALRDLREAGVPGDERERSGRGGFGRDHPERFGKDRRHDRHLAERKQVGEVTVLQRPSEERPRGRDPLELGAVVAEADDDGAAPAFTESFEQDVDALVVEQLAEVENGRLVALEPGREPLCVALVGKPLLRVAGVRL